VRDTEQPGRKDETRGAIPSISLGQATRLEITTLRDDLTLVVIKKQNP